MLNIIMVLMTLKSVTLASLTYHTFEYTPEDRFGIQLSYINRVYFNLNLTKQLISWNSNLNSIYSRQFDLHNIQQNNITFLTSQTYVQFQYSYNLVKSDRDLELITAYAYNTKTLKIYQRVNQTIKLIDEEIPSTNSLNNLEMSKDGREVIVASSVTRQVVSYQWNGTEYNLKYSLILPYTFSSIGITPDGRFFVYVQIVSVVRLLRLRIVKNDPTFVEVLMTNFSMTVATTSVSIYRIAISNPATDTYDIILHHKIDSSFLTNYFTFYSNTNTISTPQLLTYSINYVEDMILTQNGKYLAILYGNASQNRAYELKICQKQASGYVSLFSISRFGTTPKLFYTSEDASFVTVRSSNTTRLLYLFSCDVNNCLRCKWKNVCESCKDGFVLDSNQCKCPIGRFNLSGTCISCAVSNCIACSGSNICSSCTNGFSLSSGLCICDSFKNISQITGQCISCNVTSCYKCSYPDVCDLFTLPINSTGNLSAEISSIDTKIQSLNHSLNDSFLKAESQASAMKQQYEAMSKQLKNITIAVIVLVLVIILLISGGIVILYKVMSSKLLKNSEVANTIENQPVSLKTNNISFSTEVKQNNLSSSVLSIVQQNNLISQNDPQPSSLQKSQPKYIDVPKENIKHQQNIINVQQRKRRRINWQHHVNDEFKNQDIVYLQ